MKGWLVFISSVLLKEEEEPDIGISGMGSDEEVIERAADVVAELWGQDGPPVPWSLNEDQMAALEAALPHEKVR